MDGDYQDFRVTVLTDPAVFAEQVTSTIRRDPVACSVLATNLDAALRLGMRPGSLWITVRANAGRHPGQVVLAGMLIPPHPLWLTPIDGHGHGHEDGNGDGNGDSDSDGFAGRVVGALAYRLVGEPAGPGTALSGVRGVTGSATPFARTWHRLTGRRPELQMRQRMFELTELTAANEVPGVPRAAEPADGSLCIDWLRAFRDEAIPYDPTEDLYKIVEHRIAHGGLTLWEDGGRPVSLAGTSTVAAGVARIGPVYTPPALRRRGYAGAVTAAATRAGFAAGARRCMLITDLANPTSNALYSRLGYRPAGDAMDYAFDPGPDLDDHSR